MVIRDFLPRRKLAYSLSKGESKVQDKSAKVDNADHGGLLASGCFDMAFGCFAGYNTAPAVCDQGDILALCECGIYGCSGGSDVRIKVGCCSAAAGLEIRPLMG